MHTNHPDLAGTVPISLWEFDISPKDQKLALLDRLPKWRFEWW